MNKPGSFHRILSYERLHHRAFTIWEMLIALVITGFLVTLVYTVLFRINHLVADDQRWQNNLEDIMLLEKEIYLAFANSGLVYQENENILFDYSSLVLTDTALFYYRHDNAPPEMMHIKSHRTWYFQDLNIITDMELVIGFNMNDTFTLHFSKKYRRKDLKNFYPNGH